VSVPFEPGERALLVDKRGRRYMITLKTGEKFHFHQGFLPHDEIIGADEGVRLAASSGAPLIAYRPSLADFILKMPRGAQVIYPKDIGLIIVEADIYPGATVLEAGTGSGALTLALARAVGERGKVISFEVREDFAARARANIESFLGKVPDSVELRIGDVTESGLERAIDRVVLDLPEPWGVLPAALKAMRPGAIFCSYVPTTTQIAQTTEALRANGFAEITTREVLIRGWHVEGQSVRPEHRMVGHTGFVTTARFLGMDDEGR
jgi:tRNA (adenine57-N1/adenine58-N1)-methyltransferase catalytic subunit